jgi:hypothetical protein
MPYAIIGTQTNARRASCRLCGRKLIPGEGIRCENKYDWRIQYFYLCADCLLVQAEIERGLDIYYKKIQPNIRRCNCGTDIIEDRYYNLVERGKEKAPIIAERISADLEKGSMTWDRLIDVYHKYTSSFLDVSIVSNSTQSVRT